MQGVFTGEERAVVLFLVIALAVGSLVLSVGRVDPSSSGAAVSARPDTAGAGQDEGVPLVDLNAATAAELELLPGIGPAKARAILELRDARGGFGTVDELDDVKGIGPTTLDRLRPFVTVDKEPAPGESARGRLRTGGQNG